MEKLNGEDEKKVPDLMDDPSSLNVLKGKLQFETDPEYLRKRRAVGKKFKIVGWIFTIPGIFLILLMIFSESGKEVIKGNTLFIIIPLGLTVVGLMVIKITEWIE